MASDIGISAVPPLASETKVGIMPPSAKPMFQDRPVPLARNAVGKTLVQEDQHRRIAGIADEGDRQRVERDLPSCRSPASLR